MLDLLLLGLIGGLIFLLLLMLLVFVGYLGLLVGVEVSVGLFFICNVIVVYKFYMGFYGEIGWFFIESCSIFFKFCFIVVYYDNFYMVFFDKC